MQDSHDHLHMYVIKEISCDVHILCPRAHSDEGFFGVGHVWVEVLPLEKARQSRQ